MANKMLDKLRKKAAAKKAASATNSSPSKKSKPSTGTAGSAGKAASTKTAAKKADKKKAASKKPAAAKKPTALERIARKGKGASTAKGKTPAVPTADINPPKKAAKKPAKKPAAAAKATKSSASPADAAQSPTVKRTVFIGCYPVKGAAPEEIVSLEELLADVKVVVQEANGVAHWAALDFSKGNSELAAALDGKLTEEGAPAVLYTGALSLELRAVEHILIKHYDVVVRGLR